MSGEDREPIDFSRVDLTGLPPRQAIALGKFTADLLLEAEERGYRRGLEALEERLKLAEIALTLHGWGAVTSQTTDLGKAALQAWLNWRRVVPTQEPRSPEWLDLIADYAAERDRIRGETLDRIAAQRMNEAAAPRNEGAQTNG